MPLPKLKISLKSKIGARGTESADEMLELLNDNWEQVQERYNACSESEKEEMLEHFNSSQENLGEALFGADAQIEELQNYVNGLEEADKRVFCQLVNDVLQIEQ